MKKLLLRILTAASLLLVSAVVVSRAAATKDPFIGVWYSTDTDGSSQRLTIGGGSGGAYHVRYFDDGATVCGLDPVTGDFLYAASAMGSLSATDGMLAGDLPVYCLTTPPTLHNVSHFQYAYDSTSDTLTDSWGVVWHH